MSTGFLSARSSIWLKRKRIFLQALKQAPRLRPYVLHVYLLFPFIRFDLRWYDSFAFRFLFAISPFLRSFLSFLCFVNPISISLKCRLISLLPPLRESHISTTIAYSLVPQLLHQVGYLGWTEFSLFRQPNFFQQTVVEPIIQAGLCPKLTLYYCVKSQPDRWAPFQQYLEMAQSTWAQKGTKVKLAPESCTHGFCTLAEQYAPLAIELAREMILIFQESDFSCKL